MKATAKHKFKALALIAIIAGLSIGIPAINAENKKLEVVTKDGKKLHRWIEAGEEFEKNNKIYFLNVDGDGKFKSDKGNTAEEKKNAVNEALIGYDHSLNLNKLAEIKKWFGDKGDKTIKQGCAINYNYNEERLCEREDKAFVELLNCKNNKPTTSPTSGPTSTPIHLHQQLHQHLHQQQLHLHQLQQQLHLHQLQQQQLHKQHLDLL